MNTVPGETDKVTILDNTSTPKSEHLIDLFLEAGVILKNKFRKNVSIAVSYPVLLRACRFTMQCVCRKTMSMVHFYFLFLRIRPHFFLQRKLIRQTYESERERERMRV